MNQIPGVRATVPPPADHAINEEFAFHLEMRTQRLVASGWDPAAARMEAARQFGDLPGAAEYCRDVDRAMGQRVAHRDYWEALGTDVRFGLRALRKSFGFSLVAVTTLALGIGANVAVFGMIRGVLINPVPVPRPDRLVALFQTSTNSTELANQISYGDYVDLRSRTDLFDDVALLENASATVVDSRGADRINGRRASPALFRLTGVRPAIGRLFDDHESGDEDRVLVSYEYWTSRLGADSAAVGHTLRIGGKPRTIVGVLPRDFDFTYPNGRTEIWFALTDAPDRSTNRQYWGYWAVARTAASIPRARLQTELDGIAHSLQREHPESNAGRGFTTRELGRTVVGDRRAAMVALIAGGILVLLIACTNLTNLLMVRTTQRRHELALRAALGAGVMRLVRGLAIESMFVSVAGGVAGSVLALLMLRAVATLGGLTSTHVDPRMVMLAAALSVVTGMVCTVWPAIVAMRAGPATTLRTSARASLGRAHRRIVDALVSGEVALSFILLVSAVLMVMTVARALETRTGFDRRDLLAFRVYPARDQYPDVRATMGLYRRLADAIATVPGVATPTFANALPLGGRMGSSFVREDRPLPPGAPAPEVVHSTVWPGYFRTMGIALVSGRDFSERDLSDSGHVTIVSERVARELFPGEDPIGRRVAIGDLSGTDWHTVIGVVADVRHDSITGRPAASAYDLYGEHWDRGVYVIVRSAMPPSTLVALVRDRIRAVDPEIPVYEVATMQERAEASISNRRFLLRILAVFGGIAVVLCAVGIYGVTAQAVAQQRREIGIRMALGATSERVQGVVLARAAAIGGIGLAVGAVGALGMTRVLRALLYGVAATDAMTFAVAALGLGMVAMGAAWLPARRASRVDPVEVLRTE